MTAAERRRKMHDLGVREESIGQTSELQGLFAHKKGASAAKGAPLQQPDQSQHDRSQASIMNSELAAAVLAAEDGVQEQLPQPTKKRTASGRGGLLITTHELPADHPQPQTPKSAKSKKTKDELAPAVVEEPV